MVGAYHCNCYSGYSGTRGFGSRFILGFVDWCFTDSFGKKQSVALVPCWNKVGGLFLF